MKIVLTAPPRTGKSTVIANVVSRFVGVKRGIVAVEKVDASGDRIGFVSVNAAGESRQFMFLTDHPTAETVGGTFDVDVQAVDDFVVTELRDGLNSGCGLLYVDEIGRAQAKSTKFLSLIREIFASDCSMLGSIVYDDEPWSRELKENPDICILEVSKENRDALPDILLAALSHESAYLELTSLQRRAVNNWLRALVRDNKFISARKLFTNAIGYVTDGKIKPTETSDEFLVEGKTRNHIIIRNNYDIYRCDCDLANGMGSFVNLSAVCSHEIGVRLYCTAG